VEKLRDEILQAENTRSDLLKWKLGLVGAIGSAGLGLAGSVELHADLVLCALPPVAIYVDLLALHLTLRIMVIGSYFRTAEAAEPPAYQGYEGFVHDLRSVGGVPSPYALEDWALFYSTYALCAAVAGYGIYQLVVEGSIGIPFVLSGALGAVAEFGGSTKYKGRRDILDAYKPPRGDAGA
jgi:hypothetical protein